MIGKTLGNYEITGELGRGGMGEVYRARDLRLKREVAIKVLPAHIAGEPEVQQRFAREAQTISGLNHPHICVLHDVGEQDGTHYLVMELVDGLTLTQRLKKGPVPLAEVLRYGAQIADALDRAHRAGVVHRDLKPGNVMITKSGAKLMDFGLARVAGPAQAAEATVALGQEALTAEGAIVGTFQYMAPEQLEGREVDQRADLWALGCVLYEMATGERAFEGNTQASLIGSILHAEPKPVSERVELSPPELDRLIQACLAKDPDDRVQSAHDVKLQLQWLGDGPTTSGARVAPELPAARRRVPWPLLAVLALVLGAAGAWLAKPGPGKDATGPVQVYELGQWPLTSAATPAIAPDGRSIYFSVELGTERMIQRRDLDGLQAVSIPGTEGGTGPFLSPDGRWLGFITRDGVYKVPVEGGVPVRIAAMGGINAADWGEDGMVYLGPIAWGQSGGVALYQVPANGGEPVPFGRLEGSEGNVWLPEVLPGARTVLATVLGEGSKLVAFHADGTRETVLEDVFEGRYVEPGYLLYRDDENEATMAVRFDAEAVRVAGSPIAVTEPIHPNYCFDVSPAGMLAYVPAPSDQGRVELARVRPDGSSRRLTDLRSTWIQPRVSPDGKKVVVRETGSQCQLWLLDVERGTFTRFAREGDCHSPVWSPDSRRILFDRGAMGEIVAMEVGGARNVEVIDSGPDRGTPHSWNGAKNLLAFTRNGPEGDLDLWIRDMETGEASPFLETPERERDPVFSPDGNLIAYSSDEGTSAEIYVRAYPADGSAWQVSAGGGRSPAWSSDGSELYFLRAEDGAMMRSRVIRTDGIAFAVPEPYIENTFSLGGTRDYDVGPDGSFVSALGDERLPELKVRVVLNWLSLLEESGAR